MSQVVNKNKWVHEKHYVDILKRVCDILEHSSINYWLEFGTLLGCIRNGHYIAWDADIDIAIDGNDFDNVLDLDDFFERNGFSFCVRQEKGNYKRIVLADSSIPNFHVDLYEFKSVDNVYKYKWTFADNIITRLTYKIFDWRVMARGS